jgi:hypothetical protein
MYGYGYKVGSRQLAQGAPRLRTFSPSLPHPETHFAAVICQGFRNEGAAARRPQPSPQHSEDATQSIALLSSGAAYGRTSSIASQKTRIGLAGELANGSSEALERTWHHCALRATLCCCRSRAWPYKTGDEVREHERDPVEDML